MTRVVRKPQQIERVRDGILDAATRVLANKGYAATTMSEIAAESGYTAASLYNYFRSKEELAIELARRLEAEFLAVFDEPQPRGLTFAQRLELLVQRSFQLSDRRADAARCYFDMQMGGHGPRIDHAEVADRFLKRLAGWIRDAARGSGEDLQGRKPADLAAFFWGVGNAFHVRALLEGKPLADKGEVVLDLLLSGLTGKKP